MTKLQWTAVIGALGLGVLAQIPSHDNVSMAGHEHEVPPVEDGNIVSLAISGMT